MALDIEVRYSFADYLAFDFAIACVYVTPGVGLSGIAY